MDFVKENLVSWIRVWLVENGYSVYDLIEAPIFEYFERKLMREALHGSQEDNSLDDKE